MRQRTGAMGTLMLTCLLLIVLTLLASGCSQKTPGQPTASGEVGTAPEGDGQPPADPSLSPLLERQPFQSPAGRFTIQPPRGWTVDASGRNRIDVIFSNPKPDTDKSGAFVANINVVRPPGNTSLEVLVGTVKAQVSQQLPGYQVVDDKPTKTSSGQRAHLLGGRFAQKGQQLRDLRLITVGPSAAYVVTGNTLESFYFRNEAIFRASLPTIAPAG
jgi:hypothetical protein